ncbi:MAG: hypothetical protein K2M73_08000 [Lachnospiraceae bacterium]|nr:hypothetical protein [Lachnospiraceae bacterium]
MAKNEIYRTEKMSIELDDTGYIYKISIVDSETIRDQEIFYNELTDFVLHKFDVSGTNLNTLIKCFITEYDNINNADDGGELFEFANGRITDYAALKDNCERVNVMELLKNPFYRFIETLIRKSYGYSYALEARQYIKGIFLVLDINYLGAFGSPGAFFDILENQVLNKWINELKDKNKELEARFESTFGKD